MTPGQLRQVEDLSEFLNLPFEVHFSSITFVGYEILIDPRAPEKPRFDTAVVEVTRGKTMAVFRGEGRSQDELLAVLNGGIEVVPDWLTLISDWSSAASELKHYRISLADGTLVEADEVDLNCCVSHEVVERFFWGDGEIDHLILDADGVRRSVGLLDPLRQR